MQNDVQTRQVEYDKITMNKSKKVELMHKMKTDITSTHTKPNVGGSRWRRMGEITEKKRSVSKKRTHERAEL